MKVGISINTFDLLSVEHIKMFERTKRFDDHLIVKLPLALALHKFEKNKTIQTQLNEHLQFRDYRLVNQIVPFSIKLYLENILRFFAIENITVFVLLKVVHYLELPKSEYKNITKY